MTGKDFNLLDDAWIRVVDTTGNEQSVSILELFEYAGRYMAISGEVPSQAFATTRLLLAVLHRALDGPEDHDDWHRLWTAECLPMDRINGYANQVRHRFNLFDPTAPFYQVADLQSCSGKLTHPRKIVADMPDPGQGQDRPLFTSRTVQDLSVISAAETARWLIHAHAFDPAGTKTGAAGDPTVIAGKGTGPSIGWSGQLGGILAQGADMRETLVLNLIGRATDTRLCIGGPDDLPPWEREPDGPTWHDQRPPRGAIDLYTWQTRRIRLVGDRDGVTGVVLAKGDTIQSPNQHRVEPHTAWRYRDEDKARGRTAAYVPFTPDPSRSMWRGLAALLPAVSGRPAKRGAPQPFLVPAVLDWIAELATYGYLPPDYEPGIHATAISYRPRSQNTSYKDIACDDLLLSVHVLRNDDPAAGATAVGGVEDAASVATALRQLADSIAQASGASLKVGGAGDCARDLLYTQLDEPYRHWLATLGVGADLTAARIQWRNDLTKIARTIATNIVTTAPRSAWTGRIVGDRPTNVAIAENTFNSALQGLFRPTQLHQVSPPPTASEKTA